MTRPHRIRLALATTLALACAAFLPARASELGTSTRGAGMVIHDATETLRDYCHWQDGVLVFELPDGSSWELVTTTSDPCIANPGDGSFHPFDAAQVRTAIDGVRYPLAHVSAEVFVLPYPRRHGLDSAAGPGLILLSPGVREIPVVQQHAEFVHELGHVVQYALMPDADTTAWNRYRRLRGITDESTYNAGAIHCDRPHEIFAEDFRAMYGDAQATYAGTIENAALAYPTQVAGLTEFVSGLASAPVARTSLIVAASVSHGAVRLARNGGGAATLDVFDVLGRHVAAVPPVADALGCHWTWDGRTANGATPGATVYFARARDGRGGVARIVR